VEYDRVLLRVLRSDFIERGADGAAPDSFHGSYVSFARRGYTFFQFSWTISSRIFWGTSGNPCSFNRTFKFKSVSKLAFGCAPVQSDPHSSLSVAPHASAQYRISGWSRLK